VPLTDLMAAGLRKQGVCEREVFQLIAEGNTNKDIAALLFISPSTVETHHAERWGVRAALRMSLYEGAKTRNIAMALAGSRTSLSRRSKPRVR